MKQEGFYDSDYYIVDRKYNWMITYNYHEMILFVGDGMKTEKILELKSEMKQEQKRRE